MFAARAAFGSSPAVILFGAGEGAYMLGASVLMVLGVETWLPVALVPGVAASMAFLYLGRPPQLEHAAWWALGATPLLACLLALAFTRRSGPRAGRLLIATELRAAMPAIAFGVVAAGLLTFPIVAGPEGHGGLNRGALLVSIPLSLSMGAAEFSLLWYRRRMRRLLGSTTALPEFRRRSRRVLFVALLQYVCGTVVLIVAGVTVAVWMGFAHPSRTDLPVMVGYLMLGSAMFLAILLQTTGVRAVPLAAAAAALASELALRDMGMVIQVLTPAALLVVMGCFAARSLGATVRHG
jgi:hypothetical protein